MMADRIHILEIIFSFDVEGPGGGAGRFGIELSRSLNPALFEVSVCGLWDLGDTATQQRIARLNSDGIQAFTGTAWDDEQPYRSFWRSYRNIINQLTGRSPQILHSHSEFGDIAALMLKTSISKSTLLRTVHNGSTIEWRKRPFRRLLFSYFLFPIIMKREIGVSKSITNTLNDRIFSRLLNKQAVCIPNAINLDRFSQVKVDPDQMKQELNIPPDSFIIGTIGRLSEGKGHEYLIRAAQIVTQVHPEVIFLIIGDGEKTSDLHQFALQKSVSGNVLFTGSRHDIEEILTCFDLLVSPSLWEGISTVILESMAAGVPVVATDIPGTKEIVKKGVNGWLVPPKDHQALADTIIEAIEMPELRNEFSRNSLETAEKYSILSVAREYEELYLRVLRK